MDKDILFFDIETDSANPVEANMKFFGAYSSKTNLHYMFEACQKKQIEQLIESHRVLVGFNNKGFDMPVVQKLLGPDCFEYKLIVDLWEICAPRGSNLFGKNNKNRLAAMGIKLKDYKLKTIVKALDLDEFGKGDIDYEIFKKNEWTDEELKEIEKYLKQDIILTVKLFEWLEEQFKPLKEMLPVEQQLKYTHLRTTLASLSYHIICHKAGLPLEWNDEKIVGERFSGGHHIDPRWETVKGNIVAMDIVSAYPHALIQGNLYSRDEYGWIGDGYYDIKGSYKKDKMGKIEQALNEMFQERYKAKKAKDKIKTNAYKILINSMYGATGNPAFKSLYNATTAADCTSIVRTWIKKFAKTCEEHGFKVLYGFTDSVYVLIPPESSKEELYYVKDKFIEEAKSHLPFPIDTFDILPDHDLKFIWFVEKKHNCYLYVDKENNLEITNTLLDANTPKVIMQLFNDYMKPKIIRDLDIKFTEDELKSKILEYCNQNPEFAGEEYKVYDKEEYKVKTSLQFQIVDKYGTGRHILIPNRAGIGIGKQKDTKKRKGLRYCKIEEFKDNNLTSNDIAIDKLIEYIKPFITETKQTRLII